MNVYKLSKAGVNVSEGVRRFNGNAELYERMLKKFPNETNFGTMCDAIAAKDVRTAFTAAHTLKGTAGNLSLTMLYNDIFPLVELLRKGSMDGIEELISTVARDRQAILSALEESV